MKGLNGKQLTWFGVGIFILGLGITFTIQSKLGTSPFDALLIGLSTEVGLTIGSWEIILAFIIIILNSILIKRNPEFLGLLSAVITGVSIDLWLFLLKDILHPEIWFSKLICFGIGILLSGLGTAIYLQTKFTPIPVDQFMLTILHLTNSNIMVARTIIYLLFLIIAFIFSGPIGLGTLLTVCFGGPTLSFFMSRLNLSNQPIK
ncbi:YczE/YyaS/YitT family protein [Bacillus sp. B1-b2]|uniref:YczE/YyaS/YitT family protein n=1 Tax=Bacillus sp. B1-b2 TaxID=2653201 RepID=UPI001261E508|nr:YitT family protein [Bacillus sp. B1-b2]KAB7672586.1 YitT family protein [Bacillus sp. B1-b2]